MTLPNLPVPREPARVGRAAVRRLAVVLSVVAAIWTACVAAQAPRPTSFASIVARLSEPGGDFGGDNLISNEQSYLHVMPALDQARVSGGAYLGVGPDQNFSYIAHVQPYVAYIVDIRRDNLLLQLFFKSLFSIAPTRVEYLSLLTGRPAPEHAETWRDAGIDKIVAYIDGVTAAPAASQLQLRARFEQTMKGFGVPLSALDLDTIERFRRQFVDAGLSLVFQVRGQGVRNYYPTFRTLLEERDRTGRQLCFLATETGYQFVRSLEARDLVIPVVGDVSGPHAMAAIAADMTARHEPLSAFYISNVEQYLYRDGTFPEYVKNLQQLPRDDRSMMIRSVFPSGYRGLLPQSVPGYYSTSLVQPLAAMLADIASGKYRGYADLILASAR